MRASFDRAFEIVVGLEGKMSNDLNDPGGFTIWDLASKYNIGISPNTTLDDAKVIYLHKYWEPSGCDQASFPMDIVLFDSAVNPQHGGNQELLNLKPESWQEFLIYRMARYMKLSKPEYVKGHIFRVLKLHQQIKDIKPGDRA